MNVQEVFNLAIELDLYPLNPIHFNSSQFMCDAILRLRDWNKITLEEYNTARDEIHAFINTPTSHHRLYVYLYSHGIKGRLDVQLEIYQNWDNRQKIVKKYKVK